MLFLQTDIVFKRDSRESAVEDRQSVDRGYMNAFNSESQEEQDGLVSEGLYHIAENFFANEEEDEVGGKKKKSGRHAPNPKFRVRWTESEEKEIQELFENYLEQKEKPTPAVIKKAQKTSAKKNGFIHKRTLSSLKNKIYRMIKPK
jgi:hypothetical protein